MESLSSIEAFKDLIQLLDDISEAVKDAETDNNAAELLPPEVRPPKAVARELHLCIILILQFSA